MRINGASLGEIHTATGLYKNINGYKTFFANRIYTGDLMYGDVLYEGFVPALIPKEWYEAEQARRASRAHKRTGGKVESELEPRRIGGQYLLSGLVYCAAIDGEEHPMHVESIPGKKGVRGAYAFFICTSMKNSRGKSCQAKRVSLRSLDQAVIDLLLKQVLTMNNLRPIAKAISSSLAERSRDAASRIAVLETELSEVQTSISNILDAIERMGYATHLQQRYDGRRREEADLQLQLSRLKGLRIAPKQISRVSDEMIESWIASMHTALRGDDRAIAARTLQQFVAKIVIKNGWERFTARSRSLTNCICLVMEAWTRGSILRFLD